MNIESSWFPLEHITYSYTIYLVPALSTYPITYRGSQPIVVPQVSSHLVFAQDLRQSIGNDSIFAWLQHDRGDSNSAAAMMSAAT